MEAQCPKCKRVYYDLPENLGNCGECLIEHVEVIPLERVIVCSICRMPEPRGGAGHEHPCE